MPLVRRSQSQSKEGHRADENVRLSRRFSGLARVQTALATISTALPRSHGYQRGPSPRLVSITDTAVGASYVLHVRHGGRDTATMTMPSEMEPGVDAAPAAELELLAHEAQVLWAGSFLVELRTFVGYLSARVAPGAHDAASAQCHAADLYLACGCTLGIPEAVRIFEAMLGAESAAALRHMHLQPSAIDEVCQAPREKLLVGGAGR